MNNLPTRPLRLVATTRCSARCAHCHHEGVTAPMADLDADRFCQEVRQGFFRHFAQVSVTGGEPLLHPEIRKIISHVVSSTQAPVVVNTNGLADADRFAQVLDLGLAAVHVSIHSSHPETNAEVFGVPYDQARVLRNARAILDSGTDLCINRVILAGINSVPAEVVDFTERWSGGVGARVQIFPDLYENDVVNERVFEDILAEARCRGYQYKHHGRHHVVSHSGRGSFTWLSPCTPEAMAPPDYAAAAIFMTPRMALKRMLCSEEWVWEPGFNNTLPLALCCSRPSKPERDFNSVRPSS
jgi:molybdenum cofactor biosynthesis enzyme MoaA